MNKFFPWIEITLQDDAQMACLNDFLYIKFESLFKTKKNANLAGRNKLSLDKVLVNTLMEYNYL